jgi:NADPH2:quinone reductase
MKALLIGAKAEAPKWTELDQRPLAPNELRIQIAACGINFPDILIQEGKYQFLPTFPYTPGGEFSGIITELGEEVQGFTIGQRVYGIERWGTLSEEIILKADRVFSLADSMRLEEAASMMYNFSTALYALKHKGKMKQGQRILILGAGGGVGSAAVQLAHTHGLKVIAVSRSSPEVLRGYGADEVYTYDSFKDKVKGTPLDLVLDTVGGSSAEEALRCLSPGGRYLVVGFAAGEVPVFPLNLILLKDVSVTGVFWGSFSRKFPYKQEELAREIFQLHASGKIQMPKVKRYAWEEAVSVLSDFKQKRGVAKYLVVVSPRLIAEDQVRSVSKKRIFLSPEEVLASIGMELGESPFIEITQEMIDDFADATLDHQWIHIDEEAARQTPFGSTIAHGFLTLSLSPKFLEEIYEMPFVKSGINYGVDKVRFIAPVKVNNRIKMSARLLEAEPSRNKGLKMRLGVTYFVEGKPICVAELLSVLY